VQARTYVAEERELLDLVGRAVREVEPSAQIILYGSRVRGTAEMDSDWDLLILLDGSVDHHRATTVRHRLYDLELEHEASPVLSAIVVERREWDSALYREMPFHENVERDGVEL
jgi:predicted nucleotidyltransferase